METRPIYVGQLTVDEFRQILREEREPTKSAEPERWLNVDEAAAYLGKSKAELHKLTATRRIPFQQDSPRGRLYFRREELDAWRRK